MSKKKNPNPNPVAKATVIPAPKKAPARKPKAKATTDSQMKKTILSAPQALKLEAAHSFMRTTAFTLQNKVRTAMTELSKIEKKTPSARLGLSFESSIQPSSSGSYFTSPFNRFKVAFVSMILIGGVCGYMYSDRVIDGFKNLGDSFSSVSSEKTWVDGMMTQTNGVPVGNDKDGTLMAPRMMEETVVPVADEVPTPTATTDVIPAETAAPVVAPAAAAPVAKIAEVPKAPKPAAKVAKKGKAAKAKASKSKGKGKSKVAHK